MRRYALLAGAALTVAVSGQAFAAYATGGDGSFGGTSSSFDSGVAFASQYTVTQDGLVANSLGFIDTGADGLNVSHTVSLYDISVSTTTPIGSVTVPSGNSGVDIQGPYTYSNSNTYSFHYVALDTPVALVSGDTYGVVGYNFGAGSADPYAESGPQTIGAGLTYAGGALGFASSGYPTITGFDGYGTTSMGYSIGAVPEPASLGLLGLGSLTMLARRRRSV